MSDESLEQQPSASSSTFLVPCPSSSCNSALSYYVALDLEIQGTKDKVRDLDARIYQCTLGLLGINPKSEFLMEQRSLAFLKLRCFRRAYEDAVRLLELNPNNFNGFYFKIKSLFGLDEFQKAIDLIHQYQSTSTMILIINNNNNNNEYESSTSVLNHLLTSAQHFLQQQSTGVYDMSLYYNNYSTLYHETANYLGPLQLKVINSIKGRGLVATSPISKGSLVIVSKALNLIYNDFTTEEQELKRVMQHEPELLEFILNLHGGGEVSKDTSVVKDKLRQVFSLNNFQDGGPKALPKFYDNTSSRPSVHGVFYYPSFLNHSCWNCNCFWSIYCGIMFVRAFRDIAVGEELTISYVVVRSSYSSRSHSLEFYGINCDCGLCVAEGQESSQLHAQIDAVCNNNRLINGSSTKWDSLIALHQLKMIHFDSSNRNEQEFPPLCLFLFYVNLAQAYSSEVKHAQAIQALEAAYNIIIGTAAAPSDILYVVWGAIQIFIKLAATSQQHENSIISARRWLRLLKVQADILIGPGSFNVLRKCSSEFRSVLEICKGNNNDNDL